MSGNGWLARQRKSDLVEIAQTLGLKDYESYKKTELEVAIDEHLSDNVTRYQADPRFQDYFKSRARAGGSPIKKESLTATDLKPSRRRAPKPVEEVAPAEDEEKEEEETEESEAEEKEKEAEENTSQANTLANQATETAQAASNALVRTPRQALAMASRLQLPATPADVAQAVDRSTVAVRAKVAALYRESRLTEATQATRAWLSTVHSVVSAIALFELYRLRPEVLPDRYAFTIPAISFLGTRDYPVHLPDMFALVTAGFWVPVLTWALTSVVLPSLAGYFFNLSAAAAATTQAHTDHQQQQQQQAAAIRTRRSSAIGSSGPDPHHHNRPAEYVVDPVTFSIVKAIVTYVVYAQGVTFGGLIDPDAVNRINSALYSGWRGVLVGTAVSGVMAVYDAVLRK